METCWHVLGLPGPTPDAGAVRRAYAARLKTVRADTDPAGFMRLRDAYEAARERAKHLDAAEVEADDADGGDDGEPRVEASAPALPQPVPLPPPDAAQDAFSPLRARAELRRLEDRLARARQRAVERAVEGWLDAFAARAADPAARELPPFPPGADLNFAEELEQRLAARLADDDAAPVGPDLWQALETRFGWHDDRHPVWREHPWLEDLRDEARAGREARARWPAFLAAKGIFLEAPAGAAPDSPRATAVFRGGALDFHLAWHLLDAPARGGRRAGPGPWSRLRAYNSRLANAVGELLDEGRARAPGFWEARLDPATLAYWDARSRRHRGLGFLGLVAWLLVFIPALVVPLVVGMGQRQEGAVSWLASGAFLLFGLGVAAFALEAISRLRWALVSLGRRLGEASAPVRKRLQRGVLAFAVASLVLGGVAGLAAPPLLPMGLWLVLALVVVLLGWLGLGLPPLSVVWLLGIVGGGVDFALLDALARDAPGRPSWAWAPLVVVANRLLLWQVLTRLPGRLLGRLAPGLLARAGGGLLLLLGALWLFGLPLALRHGLGLPPLESHRDAPPALPVAPPAAPRAPADDRLVLPLRET